jgi:hypothetical protein
VANFRQHDKIEVFKKDVNGKLALYFEFTNPTGETWVTDLMQGVLTGYTCAGNTFVAMS